MDIGAVCAVGSVAGRHPNLADVGGVVIQAPVGRQFLAGKAMLL